MAFPFDFRLRVPEAPLGRVVASIWYARGTVPYRREKVAPTGSSVAVIVLGDPIIETAGGPLRNIEQATGLTVADFAREVADRVLEGHAGILAFLKAEHGLSHGNANAMAHAVRELAAGGPAPSDALLDAQYAGPKAALRPICERLTAAAATLGPDVDVVVQKTGVALRRRRQFGLVQAPWASRVALGLNLPEPPDDARVVATPGAMCGYRVDLQDLAAVDDDVLGWLAAAYERAG